MYKNFAIALLVGVSVAQFDTTMGSTTSASPTSASTTSTSTPDASGALIDAMDPMAAFKCETE